MAQHSTFGSGKILVKMKLELQQSRQLSLMQALEGVRCNTENSKVMSHKFLSYFKPCIIPLEGGIASGFKTYEEEEFEIRLYVCKGKRVVRLKQVPFSRSSLNHDDVFILDTEKKIFQFNGANSNI